MTHGGQPMSHVERRVWAKLRKLKETQHGWLEGGDLPDELREGAAKRLGYLCLVVAGILSVFFLFFFGNMDEAVGHLVSGATRRSKLLPIVGVTAGVLGSLTLFFLSRREQQDLRLLLKLGAAYQVLIAFDIGLMSTMAVLVRGTVMRGGWSGVAVWVIIFAAIVPSSPVRTLWVSILSALMHPRALGVLLVAGYSAPGLKVLPQLFLPTAAAVVIAVISSRISFRVGKALAESKRMGSYELIELLGKGGMGEVWRARHMTLVRPAAIKMIRAEALGTTAEDSAMVLRRFEREAQATAALESENTITVYDFGVSQDGSFFYVMELLDGLDLEEIVKRFGQLCPERTVYLLLQVCDSLAEAHQSGLVHRDVKPANIHVCRRGLKYDCVKVLDFGLVKYDLDPGTKLTLEGSITGTPAYMAPEIIRGDKEIGPRADLYLVGCVAYWMLTGELVFPGKNAMAALLDHAQKQPVPPSQRTEQSIPRELERVVLSCLEKDPAKRPQSASDLAAKLEKITLDQPWNQERAKQWWGDYGTKTSAAAGEAVTIDPYSETAAVVGASENLLISDTLPISSAPIEANDGD